MLSLLIFFFLLSGTSGLVVEPVDVLKTDYCKYRCNSYDRTGKVTSYLNSTLCRCRRSFTHKEELQDLVEFRRDMLEIHNKLRNMLAAGKVKHHSGKYYPKASNMRAVSYSLELEYGARCWAVNVYDYHDKCRATSKFENVGQNLHFHTNNKFPWEKGMYGWWHEYNKYHPDMIPKFVVPKGMTINDVGHFVQLAWATMYQVGCARSFNPTNNKSYNYAAMCNYAIADYGPNIITYPVYNSTGEPCSRCRADYKVSCNAKFPNLCGEIDPVPLDAPVPITISGEIPTKSKASADTAVSTAMLLPTLWCLRGMYLQHHSNVVNDFIYYHFLFGTVYDT